MNNWRLDPVTKAQKRAIRNMCKGWKIERNRVKNKGEACDEITRLTEVIAKIKANQYLDKGLVFGMSSQDEWAFEVGYGPFH